MRFFHLSDGVLTAIAAAVPPTIAAVMAFVAARRAAQRVIQLHVQINSRMDDWMASVKELAHAQGKADGISSERDRSDAKGTP